MYFVDARYAVTYFWLLNLCAKVFGATSSEGFLVSVIIRLFCTVAFLVTVSL